MRIRIEAASPKPTRPLFLALGALTRLYPNPPHPMDAMVQSKEQSARNLHLQGAFQYITMHYPELAGRQNWMAIASISLLLTPWFSLETAIRAIHPPWYTGLHPNASSAGKLTWRNLVLVANYAVLVRYVLGWAAMWRSLWTALYQYYNIARTVHWHSLRRGVTYFPPFLSHRLLHP